MNNSTALLRKQWGMAIFQRGNVLCVRFNKEQVILVEPKGGFMWLEPYEVKNIQTPSVTDLSCAICGIEQSVFFKMASFGVVPQTIANYEATFGKSAVSGVITATFLTCVGKQQGRNVWRWCNRTEEEILNVIQEMSKKPTIMINNPVIFNPKDGAV